jgi:hypothetical protein
MKQISDLEQYMIESLQLTNIRPKSYLIGAELM